MGPLPRRETCSAFRVPKLHLGVDPGPRHHEKLSAWSRSIIGIRWLVTRQQILYVQSGSSAPCSFLLIKHSFSSATTTFPPIDLSCNTELRSVHFDLTIDSQDHTTFVVNVLSQITSNRVEQVSFALIGRGDLKNYDNGWAEVDGLLAQAKFSALRMVNVHRVRWAFEYTVAWFIERLPKCHDRGVLRFMDGLPNTFV